MGELTRATVVICLIAFATAATQVSITKNWYGGFFAKPCIAITKTLQGWKAHVQFSADVNSVVVSNAMSSKISSREFLLSNTWQNLNPGDQLCFVMVVRTSGSIPTRIAIWIEGMDGPDGSISSSGGSSSTSSSSTSTSGGTSTRANFSISSSGGSNSTFNSSSGSTRVSVSASSRVSVTSSWNGGFQASICVSVSTTMNGWKARVTFSDDVDSIEVTNASPTKISSREFYLTNDEQTLNPGSQLCFVLIGRTSGDIRPRISVRIEANGSSGSSGGSATIFTRVGRSTRSVSSSKKNYGTALKSSILFYYAQRSGKLPANNPISWRGDSALKDCVTGGWYDAGDHVKFGLPLAATTHLLAWSMVQFKDGYVKAGQLNMMYDNIKWPLDYFLKGWKGDRFIAQIGDGDADHAFWGRPEDMTMARPCKWIRGSTKGADIAGETAAALAASSIAFRSKNSRYATRLLNAAKSLYSFAKRHRGVFAGSQPFYRSSGDKDEMCEAAIWLYKATKNQRYLNEAKSFGETRVSWSLSWDDKKVACQILLYSETKEDRYKRPIEKFFNNWMPGGGMKYTPCGLAWRDKWGSNRYAGNAAFAALLAAEQGIQPTKLRKWAAEQINYLLGDNKHDGGCFSYEIGYGRKFPRHPHHRGASVSGQILKGALVGGPDQNDYYRDDQKDHVKNEVAIDYNSGFQGSLAALTSLSRKGKLPATNNKCPCRS